MLVSFAHTAHYRIPAEDAVAADPVGVHAAVTDNGSPQVVTTAITNPAVPRNITATAGGTAGDIKAIQVEIAGTDANGQAINETLPAFTVNTAGTVAGEKAFATVTSITIPAHDGTGATTSIGWGDKFGLPASLTRDTVQSVYRNEVAEDLAACTIAVEEAEVCGNTVEMENAPNGTPISIYYLV